MDKEKSNLLLIGSIALGAYLLFFKKPASVTPSPQPSPAPVIVIPLPQPSPTPVVPYPQPLPIPENLLPYSPPPAGTPPIDVETLMKQTPAGPFLQVFENLIDLFNVTFNIPSGHDLGNFVLMTDTGPFIFNRQTGKCSDMSHRPMSCPNPSEVIGMGRDSYTYLLKEMQG